MSRPTPAQLRGARSMLGLTHEQAAHLAELNHATVRRAERGDPRLSATSLERIVAVYTARGIAFIGASGIERKPA